MFLNNLIAMQTHLFYFILSLSPAAKSEKNHEGMLSDTINTTFESTFKRSKPDDWKASLLKRAFDNVL